jgi:flagellar biogenesis protein FliO
MPAACVDRSWPWRVTGASLLLVAADLPAATATNLSLSGPGLPEVGFSVLRMLGALVLVLALFLAGVWGYKHWQRVALYKGRAPKLNLLEVKPLGSRHALYVVAYEQQRMLLATSPMGIQFLTHLPPADAGDVLVPVPSFEQTLQDAVATKS